MKKYLFPLIFSLVLFSACSKQKAANKIVGTWVGGPVQYGGYDAITDTLIFGADSLLTRQAVVFGMEGVSKYFVAEGKLHEYIKSNAGWAWQVTHEVRFKQKDKLYIFVKTLVGTTEYYLNRLQ
jgi:hypothetical protein